MSSLRKSVKLQNRSFQAERKSLWKKIPWGSWSLINLYISIFSGIIVSLQYDYFTPFYSTAALDVLVPYGFFFRSLHYYSSQACFIFTICHLLGVYDTTRSYTFIEWSKLIGSLILLIFLLFTGYVLKGDNTGVAAGSIAENLILSVPIIGNTLNELFFSISENGLRKVYVQHVIALDLILLLTLWNHLRKYRIKVSAYFPLIGLTAIFCMLIPAPLEPEQLGAIYIAGPWFFLGLQELLRYLPPLLAGVIIPVIFSIILTGTHPQFSFSRRLLQLTCAILFVYTVLTIAAWLR